MCTKCCGMDLNAQHCWYIPCALVQSPTRLFKLRGIFHTNCILHNLKRSQNHIINLQDLMVDFGDALIVCRLMQMHTDTHTAQGQRDLLHGAKGTVQDVRCGAYHCKTLHIHIGKTLTEFPQSLFQKQVGLFSKSKICCHQFITAVVTFFCHVFLSVFSKWWLSRDSSNAHTHSIQALFST